MKDERGQILVLVAILLPVLLTFMLFVMGTGQAYVERARAQAAVDSAALAAAQEGYDAGTDAQVVAEAQAYLDANGEADATATISVDRANDSCVSVAIDRALALIRVVHVGASATACPDEATGKARLTR